MERAYLNRIATAFRHFGGRAQTNHSCAFHSQLIKLGVSNDVFLANNLIFNHVACPYLEDARKLFDEMPDRNVVTWTTMVSGYSNCGKLDKAVGLYNRMLESESEMPNGFMNSAVLKPCGLLGDLRTGKLIHERICGERLEFDTVLMNTLLDMYFKCGSLIDARRVFDHISSKNTTTWHTLVSGFTEAGLMEEAVSLFHQMKEPSVVSWNSIIAGFADNGSSCAFEFVCIMHREASAFKVLRFLFAPKFTMGLVGMPGICLNKKLVGASVSLLVAAGRPDLNG